jgi:hypothetical protein
MSIQLDTKAITDEIMALSALRNRVEPSNEVITLDNLPGMMVLMRMVFAEVMIDLSPFVDSCNLDDADPTTAQLYDAHRSITLTVTLKGSDRISSGLSLSIKRQLEHIVATGTLGWATAESDGDWVLTLQRQREATLDALRATLRALNAELDPFLQTIYEW